MRNDHASSTALLIARSIVMQSHDPRRAALVPPGEPAHLETLIHGDGPPSWFDAFAATRPGRALLAGIEKRFLNGISLHYLARKRWIEQKARAALDAGCRRMVVIGAGFDLLAWRLAHDHPQAAFFEIDHPATQRRKSGRLPPLPNLRFLPSDLTRDSLLQLSRDAPPPVKTLAVMEGLLMYLEPARVRRLFGELAATPGGCDTIFTFMNQAADGSIHFRDQHPAITWWLARKEERFRWGLPSEELAHFLPTCGFRLRDFADHDVLRETILSPHGLASEPLARGECLCHCQSLPT